MYLHYQIFFMMLKIDVFFSLTFLIQFLVLLDTNDPEFGISIASIPVALIFLYYAGYGLRMEKKGLMISFLVMCVLGIAYFFFKLVRVATVDRYEG